MGAGSWVGGREGASGRYSRSERCGGTRELRCALLVLLELCLLVLLELGSEAQQQQPPGQTHTQQSCWRQRRQQGSKRTCSRRRSA